MTQTRLDRIMFRVIGVAITAFCVTLSIGGCPTGATVTPAPDDGGDVGTDGTDGTGTDGTGTDGTGTDGTTAGNSGVTGKFVGAAVCAQCHPTPHAEWSETLHAEALTTLEGIGQGSNTNCLPCHTVGFGQEGGFVDRATTDALAGVQCENCHGAGADHVDDPLNEAVRPVIDISAQVCGACHTGSHHPTFEQWETALHAQINETVTADLLEGGSFVNNCGICHSGDVFYRINIRGEAVPEDAFVGLAAEDLTPVTCAICHDPHARTNNAAAPDAGRDFQLRFRQVASPTPSNTVEDVTNPQRFNLCGQCHHDRGRTWETTSRAPHHSNQANVYAGEMAIPDPETQQPLVLSRVSVHSFAVEQCATCHLYREDFQSEEAPAISGHTFQVNTAGCATSGCHPSSDQAAAALTTLQGEVQARLDNIASRLGDPATWEYVASGGPDDDGQAELSDEIKQIRFLYYYALVDGSLGVHNPDYIRDILEKAESLLTQAGR
ncbi:MAG: hypothetical protein HY763_04675 [Planctomycetes bacterium]|nr:hypothetical protein [Planctomycetota bacterium]